METHAQIPSKKRAPIVTWASVFADEAMITKSTQVNVKPRVKTEAINTSYSLTNVGTPSWRPGKSVVNNFIYSTEEEPGEYSRVSQLEPSSEKQSNENCGNHSLKHHILNNWGPPGSLDECHSSKGCVDDSLLCDDRIPDRFIHIHEEQETDHKRLERISPSSHCHDVHFEQIVHQKEDPCDVSRQNSVSNHTSNVGKPILPLVLPALPTRFLPSLQRKLNETGESGYAIPEEYATKQMSLKRYLNHSLHGN